jgi:hypothetical protein
MVESALYTSLYTNTHDLIPLIVNRADQGDFSFVSSLILPLTMFDDKEASGMWMTVTCAERGDTDPNAADYSAILPRLAQATREEAQAVVQSCAQWHVQLLPRSDITPVKSSLPTLLLSGAFDPITPPEYAATMLTDLPNAQHVVFPYGSHGQAVSNACANRTIQSFLDAPTSKFDASCAADQQATFKTEQDLVTIPSMRGALETQGIGGLFGLAVSTVPGLLAILFLMTALPAYAIGWVISRFRHRTNATQRVDWTVGWSRAAPWLAIAATAATLVFFIGLGAVLAGMVQRNPMMLGLGAVPSNVRALFFLPTVFLFLVGAMVVALVALWAGKRRSMPGRLYYTALTLAGLISLSSLFSLGVVGLWRA